MFLSVSTAAGPFDNKELLAALSDITRLRDNSPAQAYEEACAWLTQVRSLGDSTLVAFGLLTVGRCAQALGRIDEWLDWSGLAAALAEQTDDPDLLRDALIELASATSHMGFPGEALPLFERALVLATDNHDPDLLAHLKTKTASALALLGRLEDAQTLHLDAIELVRDPNLALRLRLVVVGFHCDDMLRPEEAEYHLKAFERMTAIPSLSPRLQAWYLCLQTVVHAINGRPQAMLDSEAALRPMAAYNMNFYCWTLRIVADTLLSMGDANGARTRVNELLQIDLVLESVERVRLLLLRAKLAQRDNQSAEASELTKQAYALARPSAGTQDKLEAKVILTMLQNLESRLQLARSQVEARQLRLEIAKREALLQDREVPIPSLLKELYVLHAQQRSGFQVADMAEIGFHVAYQPYLGLQDLRVVGCEALLRLHHPRHGAMLPGEFIHRLERAGDIMDVGLWVVQQGCQHLAQWPSPGGVPLTLAINVSATQLESSEFAHKVAELLDRYGIAPGRLELEINESFALRESETPQAGLHALQSLGVKLSIDDFGAGHCNFARLIELDSDKVKLDRSLVRKAEQSQREFRGVQSLVRTCLDMGMAVCAEGVETLGQARAMHAIGCSALQGYWVGRPESPQHIAAVLARPAQVWAALLELDTPTKPSADRDHLQTL
ncbi:EAL domain-containing protein [Ideonella paludis]|uniref:EAL domain-containing protein n=1 Tax=Ideonella paludis TaxID=1233411 RepID=A0ABS5DWJ9_9BURK|nr:EAL domain-containing protein [Ideonella paludis]MBQ0935528.1 EAL domain-containing protein [Ideonella paludis]